ncbi:hypothetical protein ACRAVF_08055 [Bradyrhizobium oligotrophicum S58]
MRMVVPGAVRGVIVVVVVVMIMLMAMIVMMMAVMVVMMTHREPQKLTGLLMMCL